MASKPYIWKLPSMSMRTKLSICDAYIKDNCDKHIPIGLLKVFALFYTADSYTVNSIKSAQHLRRFKSPLFTIQDLLWYLDFYPNGSNDDNEGASILYLCLALLPPKFTSLEVHYTLSLLETHTTCVDRFVFNRDEAYDGWPRSALKLSQLQNVDTLTFELKIHQIALNSAQAQSIQEYNAQSSSYNTYIPKNIPLKHASYKWKISDSTKVHWLKTAQVGQFINGPLMKFGPFKLYLQFCPRGRNTNDKQQVWIGLSVWYWPPQLRKALLQCNLLFQEMGCNKSGHKCFDAKHLCLGWCADISYKALSTLDTFTIIAEVSVVSVFDTKDEMYEINDTTDVEYISNVNIIIRYWLAQFGAAIDVQIIHERIERYAVCKEVHAFDTLDINPYQKLVYEWKVHQQYDLKNIANACNLYCFPSEIFSAFGMKWYMGFWPSGSRVSRDGTVNVFINLISFHTVDQQIPIRFDITWIESDTRSSNYDTFLIMANGGGETYWPLRSVDIAALETLTIQLELTVMDIIQNSNIVTHKYMQDGVHPKLELVQCVKHRFEWKLEACDVYNKVEDEWWMESEVFMMFGMKWQLFFVPNGKKESSSGWTDLSLKLLQLPETVVSVRYTICIKECDFRYVACASFYEGVMMKDWGSDRLKTERLKALMDVSGITFQLTLELVDVYSNRTNVTDIFALYNLTDL